MGDEVTPGAAFSRMFRLADMLASRVLTYRSTTKTGRTYLWFQVMHPSGVVLTPWACELADLPEQALELAGRMEKMLR